MKTLNAIKFLFVGPAIVVMLVAINWFTSPEVWWVQWPALGLGIAWVASLFRVVRALILAGGIAGLLALIAAARNKSKSGPMSVA